MKAQRPDARWRLCFVEESEWAYFANVGPTKVRGDDWNDAPHDCNAGVPYSHLPYVFALVAFDGPYVMAGAFGCAPFSDLSAQQINRGDAPWLYDPGYGETYPEPKSTIPAGTTYAQFKKAMKKAGGHVYEAVA